MKGAEYRILKFTDFFFFLMKIMATQKLFFKIYKLYHFEKRKTCRLI